MKLNNVIFVLAIVVISVWMFQLYRNRCFNVEYYSGIAEGLEERINNSEKPLNSIYVMNIFNHLTDDESIIQEAYNSAEMNDRNTLYILLQNVKKENKNVKDK
ncbi:hypothetical protein CL646_04020 [bacterium]|jgi:hypothetical protein|nr:hypothetical protein [bacterium]|tara:strand:+ start:1091 stop:1399 length:309 start_codon:yes stop_codon:yes gene_type:complete